MASLILSVKDARKIRGKVSDDMTDNEIIDLDRNNPNAYLMRYK